MGKIGGGRGDGGGYGNSVKWKTKHTKLEGMKSFQNSLEFLHLSCCGLVSWKLPTKKKMKLW